VTQSYTADTVANHLIASASITAQNTFTEGTVFDPRRPFNVSISGTWSATVLLQRSFDDGVTWHSAASFTANAELMVDTVEEDVQWRLGVATGGFTSGTVVARLSQ